MEEATKGLVLLVDNDENALKLYEDMLREYDFDVVTAKNGKGALQQFRKYSPSVVVTDVHMPEMDGEDLFQRLKQLDSNVKVIFITGWADVSAATRLVKAGAFDYLSKPVSLIHLVGIVKNAFYSISDNENAHSNQLPEELVQDTTSTEFNLTPFVLGNQDDTLSDQLESLRHNLLALQEQFRTVIAQTEPDTTAYPALSDALQAFDPLLGHLQEALNLIADIAGSNSDD